MPRTVLSMQFKPLKKENLPIRTIKDKNRWSQNVLCSEVPLYTYHNYCLSHWSIAQCESRTGSVSPVGHYDLSSISLSEDSDSGTELAQALEQQDGEGEREGGQENKAESRISLTSSILKQVRFSLFHTFIRSLTSTHSHTHTRYTCMHSLEHKSIYCRTGFDCVV